MKTWVCTGMLGLFVLLPWASQAADIYKWTDESGVVHISDIPPAGAAAKEIKTMRTDDNQKFENDDTQKNDSEQEQKIPNDEIR